MPLKLLSEVEETKNKEKYAKEIVEIACEGNEVAVSKETGKPVRCVDMRCSLCAINLNDDKYKTCTDYRKEWAESEYIKKQVISKKDRAFLEYLKEEFKYIVRHKDGTLFAYKDSLTNWFSLNRRFDVDFPMVKWDGNEEIWSIEDLKKLEVVDSYE